MKQYENEDDIPDWSTTPLKKNKKIKALVEARQEVCAAISDGENQKKALSTEILTILTTAGVERARIDNYAVGIVTVERTSLNEGILKKELLEGGMTLTKIEALWKKCSTVARSSYVKVSERKS